MRMSLRKEDTIAEYGRGIRVYSRLREVCTINTLRFALILLLFAKILDSARKCIRCALCGQREYFRE